MSEAHSKEDKEVKHWLESTPDINALSGNLPASVINNKLLWTFIKHSKSLNKLTATLIGLTALLALVTVGDILIRTGVIQF